MKFVLIAIVLVVAGMWLKSRASRGDTRKSARTNLTKKRREKKRSSTTSTHNPYHAVSIHHSASACPSVLGLGNRRFLAANAPMTPVQECTSPHCDCKYVHHKDRRNEDGSRRTIFQAQNAMYSQPGREERRRDLGRRADDLENYSLA